MSTLEMDGRVSGKNRGSDEQKKKKSKGMWL
jgi:hypothetical protein